MDVVPDANLFNFVDNLEEKDKTILPVKQEESTTAWQDIYAALDRWSRSILDSESLHDKTEDIRLKIENSICRQQIDGLLSHFDATELRYVTDFWIRLSHAIASVDIGCASVKRNVLTLMLELYTLNQLDKELFIETCLKLW